MVPDVPDDSSVWDIDDTELSPNQRLGNHLCMGLAIGCLLILSPVLLVGGLVLRLIPKRRNKNNVEMVASSIKSTL